MIDSNIDTQCHHQKHPHTNACDAQSLPGSCEHGMPHAACGSGRRARSERALGAATPRVAGSAEAGDGRHEKGVCERVFEDGEVLIRQGDVVTDESPVYVIEEGTVAIIVDGQQVAVRSNTYVGESAVMGATRTADVVALGRVVCLQMDKWTSAPRVWQHRIIDM